MKKKDDAADSQGQQQQKISQNNSRFENGSGPNPIKPGEPSNHIVSNRVDKVGGDHLMQAAKTLRRQLKLLDTDVAAGIAKHTEKQNTRAGKEKERDTNDEI